ncbi:MAG TPA: transcription antitermination factor NusB [Caldimonas sp.]
MSAKGESAARAPRPRVAGKRVGPKSTRRRAREFALQGVYEWLLSGTDAGVIAAHVREQDGFDKCDAAHFDLLLHGVIRDRAEIDAILAKHIDRKAELLSPVEHAALMIGTFELMRSIEIPYKVAINEAVELAKSFGGTDGHKYVNGVLDKVAAALRPDEVDAARTRKG